jgi:hypothetical protein
LRYATAELRRAIRESVFVGKSRGKAIAIKPGDGGIVSIARVIGAPTKSLGMVCGVGQSWLLVHIVDDLRFDGYECLRVQDVTGVSRGRHERFAWRVLVGARGATELEHPALPLEATGPMLRALRATPLIALVCEDDDDFLLGHLLRVDANSATIHTIDAAGKWSRSATRVALRDITRVQFGDHYSLVFTAHAPPRPAPRSTLARQSRSV